jgi:hypothetical protein
VSERGKREDEEVLTCPVECKSTLDHAVHETTHNVKFLFRLEEKEGMEVSCAGQTSLASLEFTFLQG